MNNNRAEALANWLTTLTDEAEVTLLPSGAAVATVYDSEGAAIAVRSRLPYGLEREDIEVMRAVIENHAEHFEVKALPCQLDFKHGAYLEGWEVIRPENK
jgi:hypothetical protein